MRHMCTHEILCELLPESRSLLHYGIQLSRPNLNRASDYSTSGRDPGETKPGCVNAHTLLTSIAVASPSLLRCLARATAPDRERVRL